MISALCVAYFVIHKYTTVAVQIKLFSTVYVQCCNL